MLINNWYVAARKSDPKGWVHKPVPLQDVPAAEAIAAE